MADVQEWLCNDSAPDEGRLEVLERGGAAASAAAIYGHSGFTRLQSRLLRAMESLRARRLLDSTDEAGVLRQRASGGAGNGWGLCIDSPQRGGAHER